jgi:hypothetical protein
VWQEFQTREEAEAYCEKNRVHKAAVKAKAKLATSTAPSPKQPTKPSEKKPLTAALVVAAPEKQSPNSSVGVAVPVVAATVISRKNQDERIQLHTPPVYRPVKKLPGPKPSEPALDTFLDGMSLSFATANKPRCRRSSASSARRSGVISRSIPFRSLVQEV